MRFNILCIRSTTGNQVLLFNLKSIPASFVNWTLILSLLPQRCTSEPEGDLTMEIQHPEVLHLSLSDASEELVCFEFLGWSTTLWTMFSFMDLELFPS